MQISAPSHLVTDHDLALARHHSLGAVGKAGLRRDDADDLAQQAALELCNRIARFDPQRGRREAFVVAVARNATARVIEERSAARRDWRRCRASLQDEIATAAGAAVPRADTIDDDDHARRTRGARLSSAERDDMRLDVQAVVDRMPAELRAVCAALLRLGPSDAARSLGLPRGTFFDITRRVRAHFEAAGLDAYVAAAAPAGGRR